MGITYSNTYGGGWYYYIDYCDVCRTDKGHMYMVARTKDRVSWISYQNYHNEPMENVRSFANYDEAFLYAVNRLDRKESVLVSRRVTERRQKDKARAITQDVVKFPITPRRGKSVNQVELARAEAKAAAFNDAIYYINVKGRKADVLEILKNHKDYWNGVAQKMREDNYATR